ncbi:MAG: ABC transporter permease [Actinobacteria bacterium]|nr:MAG: ABC transporter permease [Actinomycetota bacterium]
MRINMVYYTREALVSFRKNWVMSLAAVSTIAISLFLLGVSTIGASVVNDMMESVESKVKIDVFLKDTAPPAEVKLLQDAVMSMPEVRELHYVSKAEALERLKEDLKDDPEMLKQVVGNPLPASLEIWVKSPSMVNKVVASIKRQPNLNNLVQDANKDIKSGQAVLEKLIAIRRMMNISIVVLLALLGFASLVLIANTIRLAIFARRKEIAIMRLVGASNWFIRWPFMLEGIMQGLIGAALAATLLGLGKSVVFPQLQEVLRFLPIAFTQASFVRLVLILAVSGILVGLAGSGVALRRFLRV